MSIFKPKSEIEIEDSLNSMSGKELMQLALAYDEPEYAKKSLEKNDKETRIEDGELEAMVGDQRWEPILDNYINMLVDNQIVGALRVAMLTHRPISQIEKVLNSLQIDFASDAPSQREHNHNYASLVMRWAIKSLTFEEIKRIYNNPKIQGNPNYQYELVNLLMDKIDVKNALDLILNDRKFVKESLNDIFKPVGKEYVDDFQQYYIKVHNLVVTEMKELFSSIDNLYKQEDEPIQKHKQLLSLALNFQVVQDIKNLLEKRIIKIKENFDDGVPPEETAKMLTNKITGETIQ